MAGTKITLPGGSSLRFVETRCYEATVTPLVLDQDPFADEINAGQLATLPAGAHMRWTATDDTTLDTLEVNGFNGTVTISWTTSEGDSGSASVTFAGGVNPESIALGGLTLPNGGTIDFTLDSISAGQMQLTTPAASIANGWTALQDYSAFANTSHWATRLLGSTGIGERTVNVYEDKDGATSFAEVNGEDLTEMASIPVGWTLCPIGKGLVSSEAGNTLVLGDDGALYAMPLVSETCYEEPVSGVQADQIAEVGGNGRGIFDNAQNGVPIIRWIATYTGTISALQAWIGLETANGTNLSFTATNTNTSASVTSNALNPLAVAPNIDTFAFASPLGVSVGDVIEFSFTDANTNDWGLFNTTLDEGVEWIGSANGEALRPQVRIVGDGVQERRVREYSDGETTKLIEFQDGLPIELASIPAGWTPCPESASQVIQRKNGDEVQDGETVASLAPIFAPLYPAVGFPRDAITQTFLSEGQTITDWSDLTAQVSFVDPNLVYTGTPNIWVHGAVSPTASTSISSIVSDDAATAQVAIGLNATATIPTNSTNGLVPTLGSTYAMTDTATGYRSYKNGSIVTQTAIIPALNDTYEIRLEEKLTTADVVWYVNGVEVDRLVDELTATGQDDVVDIRDRVEALEGADTPEGLRGVPVADNATLTALTARDYERRKVLADSKEYVFELGALSGTLADDAATGFWQEQIAEGLVATAVNSSAGAITETLAASTAAGVVRLFTNEDVTNTATLAVAAGETLNGVTDGTFLFSNYAAGTQFRADEVAGGWVVSVAGSASSQTLDRARMHATTVQALDHSVSSYIPGSLLTQGFNPVIIEFDTADHDTNGAVVDLPANKMVIQSSGNYDLAALVTMNDGSNASRLVVQVVKNGTDIVADNMAFANGVVNDPVKCPVNVTSVALVAGDEITVLAERFNEGASRNTFASATDVYLEIARTASSETVLAGMVTPEDLEEVLYDQVLPASGDVVQTIDMLTGAGYADWQQLNAAGIEKVYLEVMEDAAGTSNYYSTTSATVRTDQLASYPSDRNVQTYFPDVQAISSSSVLTLNLDTPNADVLLRANFGNAPMRLRLIGVKKQRSVVMPDALEVEDVPYAGFSFPYNGTQYISNSTVSQRVPFTVTDVLSKGFTVDDANDAFIVTKAGDYEISASASGISGAGDWFNQIDVNVNSSEVASAAMQGAQNEADTASCEALVALNVGDVIDMTWNPNVQGQDLMAASLTIKEVSQKTVINTTDIPVQNQANQVNGGLLKWNETDGAYEPYSGTTVSSGTDPIRESVFGSYGRGVSSSGTSATNGNTTTIPLNSVVEGGSITYNSTLRGFDVPDGTAVEVTGQLIQTSNVSAVSVHLVTAVTNGDTNVPGLYVGTLPSGITTGARPVQGIYENNSGVTVTIAATITGAGNTGNSGAGGFLQVRQIN